MKRCFLFIFVFFVHSIWSQNIKSVGGFPIEPFKSDTIGDSQLNIYYQSNYVEDDKDPKKVSETFFVLQIGDKVSKFVGNNVLKCDSLLHSLGMNTTLSANEMNYLFKYRTKWDIEVVKYFQKSEVLVNAKAFHSYQYIEKLYDFKWVLYNEKRNVLGYECKKATTEYRGRKYVAWYTDSIPISNGPIFFHGLPGLILEIYDIESQFNFRAVSVDTSPKKIYIRKDTKALSTTREKFRVAQKSYYENPGFYIGKSYDIAGNAENLKLKSKLYNPIESE